MLATPAAYKLRAGTATWGSNSTCRIASSRLGHQHGIQIDRQVTVKVCRHMLGGTPEQRAWLENEVADKLQGQLHPDPCFVVKATAQRTP